MRDEGETILPGVQVICCGSYRRGKPSSGDVDLLITHAEFSYDREGLRRREDFMHFLMKRLSAPVTPPFAWRELVKGEQEDRATEAEAETRAVGEGPEEGRPIKTGDAATSAAPPSQPSDTSASPSARSIPSAGSAAPTEAALPPFVSGTLAAFDRLTSRHAQASYMGFCCLPSGHPQHSGVHRRLDIKVYPRPMFPFALLYFTGSDHFNRSMRWYAKKSGWSLSDHGLQPTHRVSGLGKVWIGRTVDCKTERDVFAAMGLEYVAPTERNVWAHFDLSVEEVKMMHRAVKEEEEGEEEERRTTEEKHGGLGEGAEGDAWAGVKQEARDSDEDAVGGDGKAELAAGEDNDDDDKEPEDFYDRR